MRPLVDPGPPLSPGDEVRFSRHTLLPQLGELGQRRLRAASVCVVGAGGLGSPALLYLAAAGVGRLGVVDDDEVDLSNLQRQVVHRAADVGRRKVTSAREAIQAVDPAVRVDVHDLTLTPANAADVLRTYDVVLDGTDNFPTRYLVNDVCAALGVPLVWGSVLGFDAQVSVFWSRPPERPAVDLRDLFPKAPDDGDVPSCARAGVLGALCGQVGALMATEAVKIVTGIGEPLLGRVLVLDALAARWREVPLRGRGDAADVDAGASEPARVTPRRADAEHPAEWTIEAPDLVARLERGAPVTLVDVRDARERSAGSIPGSVTVPLADLLAAGRVAELPEGAPLVLYCTTGVRSAQAVRHARSAGRADAVHLRGGYAAWRLAATSRAQLRAADSSAAEAAGGRARLAP